MRADPFRNTIKICIKPDVALIIEVLNNILICHMSIAENILSLSYSNILLTLFVSFELVADIK